MRVGSPPRTYRWPASVAGSRNARRVVATRLRRLRRDELPRDTVRLARYLIGKTLVHVTRGGRVVSGRIVETEAYPPRDPSGHAFRGHTASNHSLFLVRDFAYVSSFMMNVSSDRDGIGAEPGPPLLDSPATPASQGGASERIEGWRDGFVYPFRPMVPQAIHGGPFGWPPRRTARRGCCANPEGPGGRLPRARGRIGLRRPQRLPAVAARPRLCGRADDRP